MTRPKSERKIQTAYEVPKYDATTLSLYERVRSAMFRYLVEDLGLPESDAVERAEKEIAGKIGQDVCEELSQLGIALAGRRVLDLGAGLGGLSSELARRGACVVAMEPGAGWGKIASERLNGFVSSAVISAVGEAIPLASGSIDVIVSLQVLEHVQSPRQTIQEAFRVLKPGGHFYFAYENYFSFWEPHYRVTWLPLLPKSLGAIYLRLRGRDPRFLRESVTYTTFHGVRKILIRTGFECMRTQKSKAMLRSPSGSSFKWRVLKRLSSVSEPAVLKLIAGVDHAKRLFRTGVYECVQKPKEAN